MSNVFRDEYGLTILGTAVIVPLSILLLFAAIYITARQVDHHYSYKTCISFGRQSNYTVKWADYNFWTYDCLAQTSNGKWISTDNLQNVSVQNDH